VTLAVTKSDGSATYTPGGTATYTITVANTGLSDALDVDVADSLPAGASLAANPTCVASGAATCGTVGGSGGQTSFAATGASIAHGGGNLLTFTVPVAFSAALVSDPLINTVTVEDVASGATGSAADSDARSASVTLAVTKTDGSATYTPGGTATYTITVANTGVSDALDVTVGDSLPAGVTLAANASCAASGLANCGTLTGSAGQTSFGATGASIAHGAGNLLTFSVPVAFSAALATDPLVNVATASDLASGASASASDSDARSGSVILAVTKSDGNATYTPGGTATYTITVANTGLVDALNVGVDDALPAGVTLSANASCVASGAATCGTVSGSNGGTSFSVAGATIAHGAGNGLTFTVPVAFSAALTANPLINTVTASDLVSGVSASASDSDSRAASADLSIFKSGASTALAGTSVVYTVTIGNAGPSAANGATMHDVVPAQIGVTSASCGSTSGGAVCGSVTVVGNDVNVAIAMLPVGGSVVVTITGTALAAGTAVNTASVAPPPGTTDPDTANDASTASAVIITAPTGPGVPIPALSWPMLMLLALLVALAATMPVRRRR
jgi:uncharacterized repeat protein (TIGR01451 family)